MSAASHWFQDPETWAILAPVIFPPARRAAAAGEVASIAALLDQIGVALPAAPRLLDLPCGVGRHSLAAAARGWQVTGVDLTAAYLEAARAEALDAGLAVTWVHGDMRTWQPGPNAAPFDLAWNLYSSLGYSRDPADDLATLRRFATALAPGGVLVLDTMSKEILARDFTPTRFHDVGGWVVQESSMWLDDMAAVRTRFTLRRDGQARGVEFELQVYAASELKTLLRQAGFGRLDVFGDLAGAAYAEKARTLVIVAHKEAA